MSRTAPSPISPPVSGCGSQVGSTTTVDPPAALRITLTYFLFGLAWIAVSDSGMFWAGMQSLAGFWAAASKGLAFVALSAGLIYWLIRRDFQRISRANALLRAVADGATDAVFVKDRRGRYLLCNPAGARFVGKTVAEVLGKDDAAIFEAGAREVMERDRRVMASGVASTEEAVLTAAGVTRTFMVTKAPFRDEEGNVLGVVGISRDVSSEKCAERALRESDERLRLALQAASGGVWDWDLDAGRAWWSDEMYELWGVPAGGDTGPEAALSHIHEQDRAGVTRAIDRAIAAESLYHAEFRIAHPVRGERWMSSHGRLLDAGPGRRGRLLGISLDVTDRKKAEAALRFQNALLRAEAESSPDGILVVTNEDKVLGYNSRFLDLWRLPQELAAAGDGGALLTRAKDLTADPAAFVARVRAIHSDVDARSHDEVALADGRTLERYSGPIRAEDGEPLGRVWYFRDVTDRKEAARSLSEQAKAASVRAAVAIAAAGAGDVRTILRECCEAIVREMDVAFARVWTLDDAGATLELQASAGLYTHTDGGHSRIAVGSLKIGRIAEERRPHLTNDVRGDARIPEKDWLESEGLTAFAGYPLVVGGRLVGVLAMFSRNTLSPIAFEHLGMVADLVAQFIERKRLEHDRERAEQAVRESEERYRRLVDVLPDSILIHSAGEIVFCNPAFVRLMRAARAEDLLGRRLEEVFAPDGREPLRGLAPHGSPSADRPTGLEARIVRLDGSTAPVYTVSTPLAAAGPSGVITALSDLTERERSMELLRSVLGSVSDAILTIDERGVIRSANPATERVFGYAETEVIGQNVTLLMPESHRDTHRDYIADYVRTGVARMIGKWREVEGRRKDGTTFPVELTVTEFRLDGERHFTGVVRDVTSRKRLEAQFQQSQKMEAIGQLAGGVAHDFNNLLTVINGYSDMLLADFPAGDFRHDAAAAINEAGERATRLTEQLLAFSRKAIVELQVLDLNEVVGESARLLRRLIGEHVELVVVTDPRLGRVKADPGQLEQVVMNLVVNGRDAMPQGGRLTIETSDFVVGDDGLREAPDLRAGRYARLTVADTGQGMSDELKSKIFEPFFTTKGVGKGTGLGLAVVHGVVMQSGGSIFVESAIGVGTKFTLHFPVVEEAAVAIAPSAPNQAAHGGETVLLVEDEDAVRTIARLALETRGYRVLTAPRGHEALRLIDDHPGPIHLLLTDVVMPEMGGRRLAEEVQKRRPETRVLYMSGYNDDAMIHPGLLDASAGFLQKPFTPQGLARTVRAVLDAQPAE